MNYLKSSLVGVEVEAAVLFEAEAGVGIHEIADIRVGAEVLWLSVRALASSFLLVDRRLQGWL